MMSAAVLTAGVPALAVCVIVVAAPDIGIVAERSRQQRVHRRVCLAADAAVEPDARLCQRRLRTAADTAANQSVYALLHQKARQCAVPAAVGIHDLCTDNLAVRNLIELKQRGVTKVLKNLSILIGNCDFHTIFSFVIGIVFAVLMCPAALSAARMLLPSADTIAPTGDVQRLPIDKARRELAPRAFVNFLHCGT